MDNLPPSSPVPLQPGLRKRFYEPLVILRSLVKVYDEQRAAELIEAEQNTTCSPKGNFRHFVCKLAHICDSKRGGDEVTSFAILQTGRIQYWFASNQRNERALNKVMEFVADILNMLGSATSEDIETAILGPQSQLFSQLLTVILAFNARRIGSYLKDVPKNLGVCIESLIDESSADAENALRVLNKLDSLLEFRRTETKASREKSVANVEIFVRALKNEYYGTVAKFIRAKCHEDETTPVWSPWTDIHHTFQRLLSYYFAVKIFLATRRSWPELFVDFEIVPVPSSRPDRDPPGIRKAADKIILRMTTDHSILNAYRSNANDLKEWGLDKKIAEFSHPSTFKPIVHSEILLDDAIRREKRMTDSEGGEDLVRFFQEAEFGRFIGASKPTCRLCAWYFDAQWDGVDVRPSHYGVYTSWRPADVFISDGVKVEEERNEVLEQLVKKVRNDVFKAIEKRSVVKNRFDSNDMATNPYKTSYLDRPQLAQDGSVDITERMALLSVGGSRETTPLPSNDDVVNKYVMAQSAEDDEEE